MVRSATASGTPDPGSSDRTAVRRLAEKAVHDSAVRNAILDSSRLAHVGVVDDSTPFVLPVGYGRDGDRVLFHGSTASRLFRTLAAGAPTCFTVTLLDGLVVARSAFESSMHYRSVMVLGECQVVRDDEDKLDALRLITEALMPGRWADVRAPLAKEIAATLVLALPLDESSVKVSASPPDDPDEDLDAPTWAGVVPLASAFGNPVDAPDLRVPHAVPDYIRTWTP